MISYDGFHLLSRAHIVSSQHICWLNNNYVSKLYDFHSLHTRAIEYIYIYIYIYTEYVFFIGKVGYHVLLFPTWPIVTNCKQLESRCFNLYKIYLKISSAKWRRRLFLDLICLMSPRIKSISNQLGISMRMRNNSCVSNSECDRLWRHR